jgi:hypothetical protein
VDIYRIGDITSAGPLDNGFESSLMTSTLLEVVLANHIFK